MDLLALIAAEPTLLPLWLVVAFAAGMYPIGMLFQCTPCCDKCQCASGETLPDTITVTLDGFTDYSKSYLTSLTFDSCYGSGASGRIESPGHVTPETDPVPDRGPVGSVTLLNGGSGYAKLGRVAPTISATVETSTGSGASLDVTATKAVDECGLDYWAVSNVTVTNGGEGYSQFDTVVFSIAEGDSQDQDAWAAIVLERVPPEITLSVTTQSGSGAQLTPVLAAKTAQSIGKFWEIESVTVDDGGDGYTHLDSVSISLAEGDIAFDDASLSLVTANEEPTVSVSVQSDTGAGAALTATLAAGSSLPSNSPVWSVASISIDSPGTGYAQWEQVVVSVVDGDSRSSNALAYVTQVDQDGGIVAVDLYDGGELFKAGPITGVLVNYSGGYVTQNSTIESIELLNGGKYYREDPTAPPYVADVTVGITQSEPSQGSGATIEATIDDDPASETFGQITGLNVADGGDGYLAWEWTTNDCCGHYLNGQSIVLERWQDQAAIQAGATVPFSVGGQYFSVPVACVYTHGFCGGWKSPFTVTPKELGLYVGFTGEGSPAVAKIAGPIGGSYACEQAWVSDSNIESCSQFAWSATNPDGPSISVSQGGSYDPEWRYVGCGPDVPRPAGACPSCNVCCQGDGDSPEEIEVVVTDQWTTNRPAGLPDFSGTYVGFGDGSLWFCGAFHVGLYPCHDGDLPIYITPSRGDCETCIKQCRVWISGINFSWTHMGVFRTARIAPAEPSSDCGDCESTPVCSPSGKTFSLSIADPAGIGYGNGTNVATATIQ